MEERTCLERLFTESHELPVYEFLLYFEELGVDDGTCISEVGSDIVAPQWVLILEG